MVLEGLSKVGASDTKSLAVPKDFSIQDVDGGPVDEPESSTAPAVADQPPAQHAMPLHTSAKMMIGKVPQIPDPPKVSTHPPDDKKVFPKHGASIGPVLGKFVGMFQGQGMNMIFRPNPKFTDPNNDNTLELNLTRETLQFMDSSVLGEIPNRGFVNQEDAFLTGIPYMQTVSDFLNEKSGKADKDNDKVDLHFEQGLLLRVPPTVNPDSGKKFVIARLGTIPHGTTINLQGFEPATTTKGAPVIPDINITPTFPPPIPPNSPPGTLPPKGVKGGPKPFDNMTDMGKMTENREPLDFTNLVSQGSIDVQRLNNPNLFLKNFNNNNKFTFDSHITFTVQNSYDTPDDMKTGANTLNGGGGVTNISFLADGAKDQQFGFFKMRGNANVTNVTCQYWMSNVIYTIPVKAGDYTNPAQDFTALPVSDVPDQVGPSFRLQIRKKVNGNGTIKFIAPLLQYSQNVTIDFGTLSWPHISVATLSPALPILVPAGNAAYNDLK